LRIKAIRVYPLESSAAGYLKVDLVSSPPRLNFVRFVVQN
jgi:hypothetical protein